MSYIITAVVSAMVGGDGRRRGWRGDDVSVRRGGQSG